MVEPSLSELLRDGRVIHTCSAPISWAAQSVSLVNSMNSSAAGVEEETQ